jgi:DNA polymerase-3 subunit delta'
MFSRTLGHSAIKTYLEKACTSQTLPHALFFAGPDGIGKSLLAKELASHLLSAPFSQIDQEIHPDFHPLRPEGKSSLYSIETIRNAIESVNLAPFSAPCKVFLFHDAERMQPVTANALLKTVEEPPLHTILIFLSSSPNEVLPTLRSRTSFLRFHPLPEDLVIQALKQQGIEPHFGKQAQGSIGKALELAKSPPFDHEFFQIFTAPTSYIERMKLFESLEKKYDADDGAQKQSQAEYLFTSLFLWLRDQVVHFLHLSPSHLLLREAPSIPQFTLNHRFLPKIEQAIEEGRLAFSRNMKLSLCLERIYEYFNEWHQTSFRKS